MALRLCFPDQGSAHCHYNWELDLMGFERVLGVEGCHLLLHPQVSMSASVVKRDINKSFGHNSAPWIKSV